MPSMRNKRGRKFSEQDLYILLRWKKQDIYFYFYEEQRKEAEGMRVQAEQD